MRPSTPEPTLYLLNLPHTLANMHLFIRRTTQCKPEPGALKSRYVEALVQVQGHALSREARPVVGFLERQVARERAPFETGFGPIRRLTGPEQTEVRERVDAALALLARLDRRLHDWVCLLLTDILVAKGDKGAAITAGWMLGVLNLLPLPEWDEVRYAEHLLHETLHNNVFLGERVSPLYLAPEQVNAPEARVLSAIREGQLRPLDGAFHSACVSVGVAYLHYLRGDDEAVIRYLRQLVGCVQGLSSKAHLFTDYANAGVAQLQGFLARPDFEALGRGLEDPRWMLFDAKSSLHC
ncbi:MAG: HEXXH motif-containing putative peptide modification protein [Cystobacter sp.]